MKQLFQSALERYTYSAVLLRQLVKTEFKLRYQGSVLGYIWSLLKPLMLFAILYVVFSLFLRIGDRVPHFAVYLLLGIVIWSYFAEVTMMSVTSIVSRGDTLRKINFPKYVIVLAGSFSALINLMFNFVVVGIFMLVSGVDLTWTVLFLPLLIVQLFVLSLSLSFFLSAAYVRLRDISYLWEVFLQGAFYATPVLYPVQEIQKFSDAAAQLVLLTPMAQIIQDIRFILITNETVTIDQLFGTHWIRLVPILLTLLTAIFTARYFRSRSKFFAEEL